MATFDKHTLHDHGLGAQVLLEGLVVLPFSILYVWLHLSWIVIKALLLQEQRGSNKWWNTVGGSWYENNIATILKITEELRIVNEHLLQHY